MPSMPVVTSGDGPRLTVNYLIKQPRIIQERLIRLSSNQFVADSVLRNEGGAASGAVAYEESTPLFSDHDPDIVEEGGEIPIVTGRRGAASVVRTVKRAFGVEITLEMQMRNRVGEVDRRLKQARNSMVRKWDKVFLNMLLNHPDVVNTDVTVAGSSWANATNDQIRLDILEAQRRVQEALVPNTTDNYLDFRPDTLLIGVAAKYDVIENTDFSRVLRDNIADENLLYTGKLPNQVFGLDTLVTRDMPAGKAVIFERNTIGFLADERPLTAKPMREVPDRECYRWDLVRTSAVGIDQPLAAQILTGI